MPLLVTLSHRRGSLETEGCCQLSLGMLVGGQIWMDFPAIWGYLQQLQQPGLVSPARVEELHPLLVMPAALHT